MEERHTCKQEKLLMEMHGDVKTLVAEFRNMNGRLITVAKDFKEHSNSSIPIRDKVKLMWTILHSFKWVMIFLFGTGVFFKWIKG